jgi:hypothetical protein
MTACVFVFRSPVPHQEKAMLPVTGPFNAPWALWLVDVTALATALALVAAALVTAELAALLAAAEVTAALLVAALLPVDWAAPVVLPPQALSTTASPARPRPESACRRDRGMLLWIVD